jgi:carboxyl-terminal processing protease
LKVTTAKYYTPTGRCIQVLDYAHRRDDGSVGSIPDSLKRAFKTPNGRTVYDGGGIDPDIKTKAMEAHPLTQVLFEKGFLFDFATQYVARHPESVNPKTFTLSDPEYQEFVAFMKEKDYAYKTVAENELEQFTEEAKKERYYTDIKAQLDQLTKKIADNKKNELMLNKDQIKMLIEEEIVSRFHLEKGSVESRFKYDKDVDEAVKILHNPEEYKRILKIQ